jgi:hypothetical protein
MEFRWLTITAHCAVRMRQRGYRPTDLEIVENVGMQTTEGIFLRKRDAEPELQRLAERLKILRQEKADDQKLSCEETVAAERDIIWHIEQLRRLAGTFIPSINGCALSIYRPSDRRTKYILRDRRTKARRRAWRGR